MTGAELLKRRPGDLGVRRALARYHMEIGQEAESLQHWQAIFDCDGSDIEAAYQLWRLAPHDRRIATLGDRQKATLSAARAAIDGETEEIDHVAICGVSYCGSTLLDRILGGLDGVGSIGESHWLTKYQTGRGEHRQLDLDTDIDGVKLVPCSVCGDNCEFLTHDFRLGMAADRRRWYHRIAARLGVTCLISSDKNYAKLLDNDPLLRFKCLVLFKSPEQAWRSKLNKLPEGEDPDFYLDECRKYIDVWTRSYRFFLDLFAPQRQMLFLSFDEFVLNPERLLRSICLGLDLPFDPGVLNRTLPGHAVGGNPGSMRRLREDDYRIAVKSLPNPDLPSAHSKLINASGEMLNTHSQLMKMHHSTVASRISSGVGT